MLVLCCVIHDLPYIFFIKKKEEEAYHFFQIAFFIRIVAFFYLIKKAHSGHKHKFFSCIDFDLI